MYQSRGKMRELLTRLETDFNAVHAFRYRNTSSWVRIKSDIDRLLPSTRGTSFDARNTIGLNGLVLFLLSVANYVKCLQGSSKKTVIYVGAGSGLFCYEGKVKDSYFPFTDISPDECLYWLSGDYPGKLIQYREYLTRNKIVIFSYIVAPLSAFLVRLLNMKSSSFDTTLVARIIDEVRKSGFNLSKDKISYSHKLFIIRYWIFRFLIPKGSIKKAYIVSAYSYSEICAVLKERGVEIIELQHGMIVPEHRGYNYAVRDESLPTPDYVNVYNNFWKQELIDAGYYPQERIRVTGRLKYELIRHNLHFNKRFIVFTGQGLLREEVIRFLKNGALIITKLNTNLDILYLPHPNESESDIKNMRKALQNYKNIKIGHPSDLTTEECIYYSIAHVSIYSSCHFDALFFKNISYVFDIMENNPMKYYMDKYPDKFIGIRELSEIIGYTCVQGHDIPPA